MGKLEQFINNQLSLWPLACDNYRGLRQMKKKKFTVGALEVAVCHNPARIVSSAAAVDAESIKKRKCFLCAANRPSEQIKLDFEGRKGRKYDVLVNPYPIFPEHLVIASQNHESQSISRRFVDMLDFAEKYQDYSVFYNGPECGASAPDHLHFQATKKGFMPLLKDVEALLDRVDEGGDELKYLSSVRDAELFHYQKFIRGVFVLKAETSKSIAKLFYRLVDCTPVLGKGPEPMFNLFVWYSSGEYRSVVIFRASHRSHHYFSEGAEHLTMSPGCADMAGYLIAPVKAEFEKLDEALVGGLLAEVALNEEVEAKIIRRLTRTQEEVQVGIMMGQVIDFEIFADGAGKRRAVFKDGKVGYDGAVYDELYFSAKTPSTMFAEPSFMLYDVTIGVGFHWERKENQSFGGALKIVAGKDGLIAINIIGIEDYLVSVISSEMNAGASLEFLKAHVVISRSWLKVMMDSRTGRQADGVSEVLPGSGSVCDKSDISAEDCEVIRWYDRENHQDFDVCADDHCQRYQGLTRAVGQTVRMAVDETWGQVLMYDEEICDTRFSKCCGGVTEKFSSCWGDVDYSYLTMVEDRFCADVPAEVLSQVLNSYDMETADYYRWTVSYGVRELSELFARKTGMDVGEIRALEAVERGVSGRIVRLRVVGSKRTVVIGKELEIRRALSESHLKSSAFEVEFVDGQVVLSGSGWGHGVGLCQIGAANMAAQGHCFEDILEHYYPGSSLGEL